jgi:hypothetical protein
VCVPGSVVQTPRALPRVVRLAGGTYMYVCVWVLLRLAVRMNSRCSSGGCVSGESVRFNLRQFREAEFSLEA